VFGSDEISLPFSDIRNFGIIFKTRSGKMKLLKPAKQEMAYLKLGIYGEAGSGKTFTASNIAMGLHKYIKAKKPIAFLDTETGSDFLIPKFEEQKIELVTFKSRAFSDLLAVTDEAEKECSILIIDSISHFWEEFMTEFKESRKIERILIHHWGILKPIWKKFNVKFIDSRLHIILCGRAADVWEDREDEEGYTKNSKVGTKMGAEKNTSYEPSLLVEMFKARVKSGIGEGWVNRMFVDKDRFDVINLKTFDKPTFNTILPHVELLNIGGKHKAIEQGRDSKEILKKQETGAEYIRKKKALLGEIKNTLVLLYGSSSVEDKKGRIRLMKENFNVKGWESVEALPLDKLETGFKMLEAKEAEINESKNKEKK
jgi:ABC-type dipeptide/oligopeptide/nickel transport system ATPase component